MAGVASTMMSPPILISPSCRMPSLLMSTTDSRRGSTRFQALIHSGSLSNGRPTTKWNIWYLTNTANAGAVKYSKKMKNRLHVTESRASFTDGVV